MERSHEPEQRAVGLVAAPTEDGDGKLELGPIEPELLDGRASA